MKYLCRILFVNLLLIPCFLWATPKIHIKARMDLLGTKEQILLSPGEAPANGSLKHCNWFKDRQNFTLYAQSSTLNYSTWQDFEISFTPQKDGKVTIRLLGNDYRDKKTKKRIPLWVCWSNIKITGVSGFKNGDFAQYDKFGRSVGWHRLRASNIVKEKDIVFAKAWHNRYIQQRINVKAGQKVTVTAKVKAWKEPEPVKDLPKISKGKVLKETFAKDSINSIGIFGRWKALEGGNFKWCNDKGHNDNSSIYLGPGPKKVVSSLIPVEPGAFLKLTAWLKAEKYTGENRITMEFFDKDRKRIPYGLRPDVFVIYGRTIDGEYRNIDYEKIIRADYNLISHPWTLMQTIGKVPENAAFVRIGFSREGYVINTKKGKNYLKIAKSCCEGNLWLDDITLIALTPEQTQGKYQPKDLQVSPGQLTDADYVTARKGQLYLGNKPIRIWSIEAPLGETNKETDRILERISFLGFNGIRFHIDTHKAQNFDYTPGDGSYRDRLDYMLAVAPKYGLKVWNMMFNAIAFSPNDVNLVNDPATAKEWQDAVTQIVKKRRSWRDPLGTRVVMFNGMVPLIWDARLQKKYQNSIKKILSHKNKYNGLTYGQDPVFYNWEFCNEQWWLPRILWGMHLGLPDFFQKSFQNRWNQWLKKRYGSNENLKNAWGKLLPDESLANNNVKLIPLSTNSRARGYAKTVGIDVAFATSEYAKMKFSPQRGSDVVHFLSDILIEHKNVAKKAFRSSPERGAKLFPITYDTGYNCSFITLYIQSYGDVITTALYEAARLDKSKSAYKTAPFKNILTKTDMHGFIDDRRIKDKVTAIYENMPFRPYKYRIAYIYRLLAATMLADYDIINWHNYGRTSYKDGIVNPYSRNVLGYSGIHHSTAWVGTGLASDEIMLSAMKIAGLIFRNNMLKPFPHPITIQLGSDDLFKMKTAEYFSACVSNFVTAANKGIIWEFKPNQKKTIIEGEMLDKSTTPLASPTPQIKLERRKKLLQINTPAGRAIVGSLKANSYKLGDLQLQNISLNVPENMPFYIPGERFAGIGIAAEDNTALKDSKSIFISAVSFSANTGLKIDFDALLKSKRWAGSAMRHSIVDMGTAPVRFTRVGVTLCADWLKGCKYKFYDFDQNIIGSGVISDDRLRIPDDKPIFLTHISK